MKMTRKSFLLVVAGGALPAGAQAKRWAMAVDIEKCRAEAGCTKCTQACHQVHNVPVLANPAHEVKWIWKAPLGKAMPETEHTALAEVQVPVFCNHCDNPPCTRVCPTQATWKREDGIVMMDWHRCIGCRYCVAACPYGSRSFNWSDPRPHVRNINRAYPTRTKGVVEKCTFCEERLAKGQGPACVEACPAKAMAFGDWNDPQSPVRQMIGSRFNLRRRAELGTRPEVFYIL